MDYSETDIEQLAAMSDDEFEAHLAELQAEKFYIISDAEAAEIEAYLDGVTDDADEYADPYSV